MIDTTSQGFKDPADMRAHLQVSPSAPIVLIRSTTDPKGRPASAEEERPYILILDQYFQDSLIQKDAAIGHELAHYWDETNGFQLSTRMENESNWGDPLNKDPMEDFVYATEFYFWPELDPTGIVWTDNIGQGRDELGLDQPDTLPVDPTTHHLHVNGTEEAHDRYDWVRFQFTQKWRSSP